MKQLGKLTAVTALLALAACAPKVQEETYLNQRTDSSIVGGEEVSELDPIAASTVFIFDRQVGALCTGTLISENLVLTAAHCTNSNPKALVIGFGTQLPTDKDEHMELRLVIAGQTHPDWEKLTDSKKYNWGDLALLRFDGPLPEGAQPASLLSNAKSLKNGMRVTLAGYGVIDMVKDVSSDSLRKVDVVLTEKNYSKTELLFEQYQGKGACHGDSGGPALATSKGKLVVVGVTSRAATEAGGRNCLEGSIYTSVAAHLNWIKKAAKELNEEGAVNQPIKQPRTLSVKRDVAR